MAAFFADLGSAADRVTLVTMSEFGRRVEENGGHGTDHGHGNAMLLMGAGVRGGQVHGRWPGLGSGKLIDGDLAVDHRLPRRAERGGQGAVPEASLPSVFPGFAAGSSLGVMR